ncbi:MAG: hypothetical protein E6344_02555 [Clostridium sp.]|nr:hypothetical protein [Clostridium sp.]MDU7082540.1 hypothetical protein [Clostridium sp.]
MKGINNMKNVDMQTLIKIALGCVILFLFSPLIFSIFGIIAKVVLWFIIAIVLIITLSIMYFKHKVKKSENGFYSFTYGEKDETVDTTDNVFEESEEEFNTANVVDVEFEEADNEDEDK